MPERVWYDAAIDALSREDAPSARLAALRMLRAAPRSWDAVMVVALTSRDEALQVASLEALASQAKLESSRRPAFERLGRLHVWSDAARDAWLTGWRLLEGDAEAPASTAVPCSIPPAVESTAQARQLEVLMAERSRLAQEAEASRQEAESLRGELVALRVTCLEVEGRLAAQVEAATRLERSLGEARTAGNVERENLKRRLAEREAELEGLSEVAWRSDRARRRWTALAAGGSLVAAGIIAAVVAARAPVMAVEPGTKVLAASEAEGYRKALVALAAEASRMEADGDRGGALVAWRSISAISTDTGLSAHAEERVQELSAAEVPARVTHDGAPEANLSAERFRAAPVVRSARMEASPDGAGGPRERRAVGRSQTVRQVEKPRPARARPAPARGIDGGGEIVPADVRAKILELP